MAAHEKASQSIRALAELRTRILGGDFCAGARLRETALAQELDLSRTPLRQAMDRLVEEGLLERLPNGGCRVASFTLDDVRDAIELRGVLEGTAARLAAERGPIPALFERIEQVVADLDAALGPAGSASPGIDFPAYVALNAEFHDLLAQLSGSAMILREVNRATRLPVASPSAFLEGQGTEPLLVATLDRAQSQHREVLDAIAHREGSRAEAVMRAHARLARENLDYVMREKPNLADQVPGLVLVSSA